MSEVFADCVLNFDDLYNGWRIVERCRLAQCSCSLNLRDFVMFYWLWFTYFCAFGALVVGCIMLYCIFTCLGIDILYTLAFSEKLELLYLRAHWCQRLIWKLTVLGSALKIGICAGHINLSGQCRDMFWNVSFGTDYVSVWCCDQISINHKCIIWFFGSFFEVIDSWLETCGIHWELAGIGHSCCFAELNLLGTLATWMVCYSYFEFFILLLLSTFGR